MKKLLSMLALALMLNSVTVAAQEKAVDIVVHIDAVEYTNPIRLWHPYFDYWYHQGPLFEDVALEKLQHDYHQVAMCEAEQSGKVLLWLKPKMFFNPQVQMFYGKVTAIAYTGIGQHFATYEAESGVWGFINQQTETRVKESYALAMDGIIQKIKSDPNFQTKLDAAGDALKTAPSPCSMITLLPPTRIRAMPF